MKPQIALDYTKIAEPLAVDDILSNLQDCYAAHCRSAAKIIMWEHQWDYITKKSPILKPKYMVMNTELDDVGIKCTARPYKSTDGGTLWGTPVEVREA